MKVVETDRNDYIQIGLSKDGEKIDLIFVPKKKDEKARSMRSRTELINTMKKRGYDIDEINKVMEDVDKELLSVRGIVGESKRVKEVK